jgi:hypothetical protein
MLGPFKYSPLPLLNDMPVIKASLKRPAAAKAVVMKRPAAAAKAASLNEKVAAWKKGLDSENEDEEVSHDGEGDSRDKGKGQKFAKVKANLPPHILDLYENEAKKHSSPRDFRTMIINKLFTRLPNGQLQLNCKAPIFEEHKTMMERKFGTDEHKALPRSIMKGKYFANDNAALDAAVADGSVKVTVVDGSEFFAFRVLRAGIEKSTNQTQTIRGAMKITNDQYALMASTISALGWSFDFDAKVPHKLLDSGKLSEAMTTVLGQAKESNEKLQKESMKILSKLSNSSPLFAPLKKGITAMDKNLQNISHVLTWKELPDETAVTKHKFDKFIFEIAEATEKMNELVLTTKASLKAKLN